MFKSSFSKYLLAFVAIILISFLMLSGIVTSMIRNYSTEEKRRELESSSSFIANRIEAMGVSDIFDYLTSPEARYLVTSIVYLDSKVEILILDETGRVLIHVDNPEVWSPSRDDEYVSINITALPSIDEKGNTSMYSGDLEGHLKEHSLVYSTKVEKDAIPIGYVLAVSSTYAEDNLISTARRAVVNSSLWVMLAAVIAAYFITERLVNPLRNMTKAVRQFGKGELDIRVVVSGKDEVAELGYAFNSMAESLQNLEKMRNSFLANVSHDLRTPMTTIAGFIEGINSGAIPPEKHEYYLGIISSEIHRLSRLVSQLLDVSRLESGDKKFVFADFDIAEMARIILISFEQKIEEKRLDVEFIAEQDKMMANGDVDAIHQVLYNLCHNAIKFANEGGRFIIRIEHAGAKKIKVSVLDDGECLTGEDKERVFDRFYKSDQSRGLDKNGVGLGLYICKTIVEAHGEKIGVISETEGCEFWFTLKEGEPAERRALKPVADDE